MELAITVAEELCDCDDSQSACPPGVSRLPRAVFTVVQGAR